jgi:hypothetical protein
MVSLGGCGITLLGVLLVQMKGSGSGSGQLRYDQCPESKQ